MVRKRRDGFMSYNAKHIRQTPRRVLQSELSRAHCRRGLSVRGTESASLPPDGGPLMAIGGGVWLLIAVLFGV